MLFLYNSKGDFIAFKINEYLYDEDGKWIGWFPYQNEDAYDINGNYYGSIINNQRLYKVEKKENLYFKGRIPKFPGYPQMFPFPKPIEKDTLTSEYKDIKIPWYKKILQ